MPCVPGQNCLLFLCLILYHPNTRSSPPLHGHCLIYFTLNLGILLYSAIVHKAQLKPALAFKPLIHPPLLFSASHKADGLPLRSARPIPRSRPVPLPLRQCRNGGNIRASRSGHCRRLLPPTLLATANGITHCIAFTLRGVTSSLKFCTRIRPVYQNRDLWGLSWLSEERIARSRLWCSV